MQLISLLPCTKSAVARSCFLEHRKEMKVLPAVLKYSHGSSVNTTSRPGQLSCFLDLRGIYEFLQAHDRILQGSKMILNFCIFMLFLPCIFGICVLMYLDVKEISCLMFIFTTCNQQIHNIINT
jgi:hypothetical protein